MERTAMKSVAYDPPNAMKCQCGKCPVQTESACAQEKLKAVPGKMEEMQGMMPPKEDMPGLYCATGTATCGDLDFSKGCVCPTCQVWTENQLENQKYCRQGSASEVG